MYRFEHGIDGRYNGWRMEQHQYGSSHGNYRRRCMGRILRYNNYILYIKQ